MPGRLRARTSAARGPPSPPPRLGDPADEAAAVADPNGAGAPGLDSDNDVMRMVAEWVLDPTAGEGKATEARTLQSVACVCVVWSTQLRLARYSAVVDDRSIRLFLTEPRQARWLARVAPRMHSLTSVHVWVCGYRGAEMELLGVAERETARQQVDPDDAATVNVASGGQVPERVLIGTDAHVAEVNYMQALAQSEAARNARGSQFANDPTVEADRTPYRRCWRMLPTSSNCRLLIDRGASLWGCVGLARMSTVVEGGGCNLSLYMGRRLPKHGAKTAHSMCLLVPLKGTRHEWALLAARLLAAGVPVHLHLGRDGNIVPALMDILVNDMSRPTYPLKIELVQFGPATLNPRGRLLIEEQRGFHWTNAECLSVARACGLRLRV